MKGIVKLPNSDKDGRHHADSENHLMPWFSSVIIVCGKKGSGKTNLTLNMISKATPLYDRIVVVHGAGEASSEYQDLIDGCEVVEEIPGPDFWNPDLKNCLVIEEQPWAAGSGLSCRVPARRRGGVSSSLFFCREHPSKATAAQVALL